MTDKDFKRLYKIYHKCLTTDFEDCLNCPLNKIEITSEAVDLCSVFADLEGIFGALPIDNS